MAGHVIISHGLESSPDAAKATALAAVAERLGWSHERPDYRDVDAEDPPLGNVDARIVRLRNAALATPRRPLVLAGSSMGAYISGHVSRQVPVAGLFLMSPPIALETMPPALDADFVPTTIIHGWEDELIPALDVVRWAQRRRDHLVLVNDHHRLAAHVHFCATEFARFLSLISE